MIIPMRHASPAATQATHYQHRRQRSRPTSEFEIEQGFGRLRATAICSVRANIMLLALLSFHWGEATLEPWPALALATTFGCLAIVLAYSELLSRWLALAIDTIAVALLLYGTGGAASPWLALTLLLILQGGLLDNSRGALAGSFVGVVMLSILHLPQHHATTWLSFDLIVLHIAAGGTAALLLGRARGLLDSLLACVGQQKSVAKELNCARQRIDWGQLNIQLAECATLDQLVRLATNRAAEIASSPATVSLIDTRRTNPYDQNNRAGTQIPIACGNTSGCITVYPAAGELDTARRESLDQLATLAGLRATVLYDAIFQERQQEALVALWETSGLLHAQGGGPEIVRDAFGRIAAALDLDWLGLLAPDERHTLAPLLLARGHAGHPAPLISGAQLRVAAEALRSAQPLVRKEDSTSLACLPICLADHAPLVLAARGNAADAATQTFLMLFGNMIAGWMTAKRTAPPGNLIRNENGCV